MFYRKYISVMGKWIIFLRQRTVLTSYPRLKYDFHRRFLYQEGEDYSPASHESLIPPLFCSKFQRHDDELKKGGSLEYHFQTEQPIRMNSFYKLIDTTITSLYRTQATRHLGISNLTYYTHAIFAKRAYTLQ